MSTIDEQRKLLGALRKATRTLVIELRKVEIAQASPEAIMARHLRVALLSDLADIFSDASDILRDEESPRPSPLP
jgi:hypothetical protein